MPFGVEMMFNGFGATWRLWKFPALDALKRVQKHVVFYNCALYNKWPLFKKTTTTQVTFCKKFCLKKASSIHISVIYWNIIYIDQNKAKKNSDFPRCTPLGCKKHAEKCEVQAHRMRNVSPRGSSCQHGEHSQPWREPVPPLDFDPWECVNTSDVTVRLKPEDQGLLEIMFLRQSQVLYLCLTRQRGINVSPSTLSKVSFLSHFAGFLGEGDVVTQAIHDAQQLLRGGQGPAGRERGRDRENNSRMVSRRLSSSETPGALRLSPLITPQGQKHRGKNPLTPWTRPFFRTPTKLSSRRGVSGSAWDIGLQWFMIWLKQGVHSPLGQRQLLIDVATVFLPLCFCFFTYVTIVECPQVYRHLFHNNFIAPFEISLTAGRYDRDFPPPFVVGEVSKHST